MCFFSACFFPLCSPVFVCVSTKATTNEWQVNGGFSLSLSHDNTSCSESESTHFRSPGNKRHVTVYKQ